jgi:hypothetical protein
LASLDRDFLHEMALLDDCIRDNDQQAARDWLDRELGDAQCRITAQGSDWSMGLLFDPVSRDTLDAATVGDDWLGPRWWELADRVSVPGPIQWPGCCS